jgi:hypothetical protein
MNLCLSGFSTLRIQDVATILVTEEQEKNGKKNRFTHTLHAGQVTDAQVSRSAKDSKLSTVEAQAVNGTLLSKRQDPPRSIFNFFYITLTFLKRQQSTVFAWMYKKFWYDILLFPEKRINS